MMMMMMILQVATTEMMTTTIAEAAPCRKKLLEISEYQDFVVALQFSFE